MCSGFRFSEALKGKCVTWRRQRRGQVHVYRTVPEITWSTKSWEADAQHGEDANAAPAHDGSVQYYSHISK
jgi:hypothetical protein